MAYPREPENHTLLNSPPAPPPPPSTGGIALNVPNFGTIPWGSTNGFVTDRWVAYGNLRDTFHSGQNSGN